MLKLALAFFTAFTKEKTRTADVKTRSLKEVSEVGNRVATTPNSATQLQKLDYECYIETREGAAVGFSDAT